MNTNQADIGELSPSEIEAVKRIRAAHADAVARADFQIRAMDAALRFTMWSAETGHLLTYSSFVDGGPTGFEYVGADAAQMYDAVARIQRAAMRDE